MAFIIAEAGSCHEGKFTNALRLIDLAYAAGCDAVKFQFVSDYDALAYKRNVPPYNYPWSIQKEWIPELVNHCGTKIEWMCSTYLKEDIEVVAPFVKRFKISAFECGDDEFKRAHVKYLKPILISGINLHCVSKYPCPDNEANLNLIADNFYEGYSDHTKNPLSGAMAVALGAEYIETHFRLFDTSPECPDYCVARNPTELHQYIKNIRQAEILLG